MNPTIAELTKSNQFLEQMLARMTEVATTTRGLSLNGVAYAETIKLDATGTATRHTNVPLAAVHVTNHGSMRVTVTNGPLQDIGMNAGVGIAKVGVGRDAMLPLAGNIHSFYGRPGSRIFVVGYTTAQQPHTGGAGVGPIITAPFGLFDLSSAGSAVIYTAPHGEVAEYMGFTVREFTGLGGASFRFRDSDAGGAPLTSSIAIGAGENTELELTHGVEAPSGRIFLEVISGTMEGELRCR